MGAPRALAEGPASMMRDWATIAEFSASRWKRKGKRTRSELEYLAAAALVGLAGAIEDRVWSCRSMTEALAVAAEVAANRSRASTNVDVARGLARVSDLFQSMSGEAAAATSGRACRIIRLPLPSGTRS